MSSLECQSESPCASVDGIRELSVAFTVLVVLTLVEPNTLAFDTLGFQRMGAIVEPNTLDSGSAQQKRVEGVRRPGGTWLTVPVAQKGESLLAVPSYLTRTSTIESGRLLFEAQWASNAHLLKMIGPRFDQSSCTACHTEALASPKVNVHQASDTPYVVKVLNDDARSKHGSQFAIQASDKGAVKRQLSIDLERSESQFANGERYILERPVIDAREENSVLPTDWFGLRVAPALFGWGLLSAVDETTLRQLADPNDTNRDGISGRLVGRAGQIGGFGWKAEQPTLKAQIAAALANDMGVTTRLALAPDCSLTSCTLELDDVRLNAITRYVKHIGVPDRQFQSVTQARAGFEIFNELGCSNCHVPVLQTAQQQEFAFSRQVIWAYTDLLVHDMGRALSDPVQNNVTVKAGVGDEPAGAAEWRTPPLWGVGLLEGRRVYGFLHDGRAQTLDEAVLWHGGEAAPAKQKFLDLPVSERNQLMAFLRSL